MNRTILTVATIFSTSSLLLADSTIKGTALLVLAAIAAMILRRDSAATRHLVWLLAMVALLAVPVLSAMLPQWRVLPGWTGISPPSVRAEISSPVIVRPADEVVELSYPTEAIKVELPSTTAYQPAAELPDSRPALVAPQASSASAVRSWNWLNALPLVWAIGFCVLILRLMAARWMLRKVERQGTVVWSSGRSAKATRDPLVTALEDASSHLGIVRPVTLVMHPEKTIPVVWGILRYHLLLPVAAREWTGEQLRSVLLHELAHIKRRDALSQLLTQVACALHWFNPLVWIAAWRLGVERERACDDLVLASGVRPSAYAGHLLEVVTALSPARWTQSCGLAMARKSSLEGRLAAVLGKNLNRRGVSMALVGIALAIAVGIAVPLAMLRAADDKPAAAAPAPNPNVQQELEKPKSDAKLDRTKLVGDWSGEKDGVKVEVKFLWVSEHQQVQWTVIAREGAATIGAQMSVLMEPDGTAAKFVFRKGLEFEATQGRLTPGAGGTLRLEIFPNLHLTDPGFPAVREIVLVQKPKPGAQLEQKISALPPQQRDDSAPKPTAPAIPRLPKLPDQSYATTGIHCQKFREEDAKRPGGEFMGDVLESERGEDPLVLGMRVASDAKWNIGGQARVELVVRNASENDVKFPQTPRADNGLSVVAIDKDGKEHQAEIAHFDGLLAFNHLRLPPFHVVMVKSFTLRFDSEKRGISEPGVAAFHLPPGEYKLRCQWSDARPEVAHEGEWTGELVSVEHKFKLAAAVATPPASETQKTPAASEPAPQVGAKLPGRLFVNAGLRTTKDETRFFQSVIAINPNTGTWTQLQNLSESGFTVPLSPMRVSPDGRTMLFMREKDLWKCDAITGEYPARVFQNGQPRAWAPDGKEFIAVVEKNAEGPASSENWRVSADGTNKSRLSLPIGEIIEDWSPDGQWLVGRSHADGQLFIVKPDGSGRRRLTNTDSNASRNEHPRFSPDGRRTVYHRTVYPGDDNAQESRFSLRTINFDGTDDREILGEKGVVPAPDKAAWTAPMGARWSPDGKSLAVVLFDHDGTGGILAINGNWRLAIIDADGGNLRELKLEGVLNAVLPWDGPEWRAVAPAVVAQKPKPGAQLKSATEQKLKWGEPANGLRMALAWPPTLGEPGMSDAPEFYLVVQNVSSAAIRLTANEAAPNPRRLMMRDSGKPLQALSDPVPMPGDWLLQPREVAFFRLYQSNAEWKDGRTISSAIEQDTRLGPRYSMMAEMTIEKAPDGAWTGKLRTGETRGSVDVIPPQHKDAQRLFNSWTNAARGDGKIPGGVIALLGESVKTFIKNNPIWETTPQLQKMLPRFDASRDWTGSDAVALLDELAALQSTPISMALDRENEGVIRTGTPLPADLANAPWGDAVSFDPPAYPHPNGLRVAWLLEPRAAEHRLGTPLTARVLIHNSGKIPVVFRTRSWHQLGHKATDAKGADIKTESTSWMTRGVLLWYRLAPGEFMEVSGPGIGVGPVGNREDWQQTRVGTWIETKAGDEVTVTTAPLPLMDWNDEKQLQLDGEMPFWRDQIVARLSRHLPFPADADERLRLLHRVSIELFGTSVSKEINDSFVADMTPTALASLAERLHNRPGLHAWLGSLTSAPTKFRVLPADPDAAKKPRTASNPGQYTLNGNSKLIVTRRPIGERIVNEAEIRFLQPEPEAARPPGPYKLTLPDGYDTWAAAWVRGTTVIWVTQKGLLRRIDFTDPAKLEETRFEGDKAATAPIPPDILEALRAALTVPDAPKQQQELLNPKPAAPATLKQEPQEGASAKRSGDGEIVFITRDTQRQIQKLDVGDGVTLEIHGHVFHGTDVHTRVRIRWPAQDGLVLGHDESIAMDAFANRERWAIGWVRGTKQFWHVSNDLDGRTPGNTRLHRTSIENPHRIVTDYVANYAGEPIDGLGLPPKLRAKFEQFFGITQPKVVDKSGGLPEVSGQFVHRARPVKADGSAPAESVGQPAIERRWKVQFVDRDTGKPAPGVRVRLHVQNANGSQSFDVVRIVSGNDVLEPSLSKDQFATVEVVDEKFHGGGGSRVFGNVPQDWLAAEKHTDPDKPFVVKVWPANQTLNLPDDALWNTKVPFEKIPMTITNWSTARNGLRIGIRVMDDEGWRVGGKVRIELWVHNPSTKSISFNANPGRSDVGVTVVAKDPEGQDHFAENGNVLIIALPLHCTLPAGYVAKVKDFTLSFDAPDNKELTWFEPKFQELEPGKYKLRCVWSDAHPLVSTDGDWTGSLATGEVDFTLAALVVPESKPVP